MNQLRYFVGTLEAGSITRAAAQLHIAQPALSSRLARLETAFGTALLNRSPRGVQPTERGHALYVAAKRILLDLEAIASEVQSLGQEPVGTVRLGCIESASALLAYPLITAVLDALPRVRLVFMSGQSLDLYRRLSLGDLDLALIVHDEEVTGVQSQALIREEIFVAGAADPNKPAVAHTLTQSELEQLPLILPSATSFSIRDLIRTTFENLDFTPKVIAEVDSLILSKRLVMEGRGFAFFPWSVVQEEVETGRIILRRIAGMPLERKIEICSVQSRIVSIAAEAVLEKMIGIISMLIGSSGWQHVSLLKS